LGEEQTIDNIQSTVVRAQAGSQFLYAEAPQRLNQEQDPGLRRHDDLVAFPRAVTAQKNAGTRPASCSH